MMTCADADYCSAAAVARWGRVEVEVEEEANQHRVPFPENLTSLRRSVADWLAEATLFE